jgi:hypothetical protein
LAGRKSGKETSVKRMGQYLAWPRFALWDGAHSTLRRTLATGMNAMAAVMARRISSNTSQKPLFPSSSGHSLLLFL